MKKNEIVLLFSSNINLEKLKIDISDETLFKKLLSISLEQGIHKPILGDFKSYRTFFDELVKKGKIKESRSFTPIKETLQKFLPDLDYENNFSAKNENIIFGGTRIMPLKRV